MCSAAPSIGKGPSIQRPLSGHSGHGRTGFAPAPVVIDPNSDVGCPFRALILVATIWSFGGAG